MANLIDIDKVSQVYSGKDRSCRCGCGGTYRVATQHRALEEKRHGYAFDDKHVSDKFVRRVVNAINKAFAEDPNSVELGDGYFNMSKDNNKAFTAYMAKETDVTA